MLRIAVCDDTKKDIEILKENMAIARADMQSVDELEFICFECGEDIVKKIADEHEKYDVIIMDVQLGGMTGKEAVKAIRDIDKEVVICIMSRNELPIPSDFKLDTYRYIMKDDNKEDIMDDIKSILEEAMRKIYNRYIFMNTDIEYRKFDINNILYISKIKYGCEVHAINENADIIIVRDRLKELEVRLKECGFEYAHSSYMVNYRKIAAFIESGKALKLDNGEILNISRNHKKDFMKGHIIMNTREKP